MVTLSASRRGDVVIGLGQQHAALERGHQRVRELARVGAAAQLAAAAHGGQPALEQVAPPVEPGADLVQGVQVALDDLGGEGTEAASAGADVRPLGIGAGPGAEGGDTVELAERRARCRPTMTSARQATTARTRLSLSGK
jgi:hypothetical protein